WRKTIPLNAADLTSWNRYSLDVTDLLQKYPGGLVRLSIAINRGSSIFRCEGAPLVHEEPLVDLDAQDLSDDSNWDYAEDYFGINDGSSWSNRDDPCTDAYYAYNQQTTRDARNVLVSNLGLLAKKD